MSIVALNTEGATQRDCLDYCRQHLPRHVHDIQGLISIAIIIGTKDQKVRWTLHTELETMEDQLRAEQKWIRECNDVSDS